MILRFLLSLFLVASISAVKASTIEQKKIDFPIKAEILMKGENHYFFTIVSPRKLAVQYPEIAELDSLNLLKDKDAKMVVTKSVSIVKKPVGFFDDKQMTDEQYVAYIMDINRVKKLGPETFKVTVPGEESYSYQMKMFFDADDISTLPNSKVIRAVAAAKKLDVISQSASTIMVTEKTDFTKYINGSISVSSFIPMKEDKTLIITYSLWAVKKPYAIRKVLEPNFRREVEGVKSLQESFK